MSFVVFAPVPEPLNYLLAKPTEVRSGIDRIYVSVHHLAGMGRDPVEIRPQRRRSSEKH